MESRRLGPALKVAGVIVLLAGMVVLATGYMLFCTDAFEHWRRAKVAKALSDELGLDVQVNGGVAVGFGLMPRISISEVSATDTDPGSELKSLSAHSLDFNVSLHALMLGIVRPSALEVDGLSVDIEFPENLNAQKPAEALPQDTAVSAVIAGLVRAPFAANLELRNAGLHYQDHENGLDLTYLFDRLATRRPQGEKTVTLEGVGRIGDKPLTIDGKMEPSVEDSYAFNISAKHPGLASDLAGTYALAPEADTIDMIVKAQSPSLSAFLDVLAVHHEFDGEGEASGHLSGTLSATKLDQLKLRLAFSDGNSAEVSGSVTDLVAGSGIALSISGALAPPKLAEGAEKPIYDLSITGFSGNVLGSIDTIVVRDLRFLTTAVKAEFHEIGPISADRVWKDPQGRIGLYGLSVRAGDPARPSLDVRGYITDVLFFQGVELLGWIDMETASVLGLEAEDKSAELGRLQGSIAISDADGSLGIESLKAHVTDTSLLELAIEFVFDDLPKRDELKFDTTLRIPSFKAFSAALGDEVDELGTVTFNGQLSGSDERISATGASVVGSTLITGTLNGSLSQGRPLLAGDISTPTLYLDDVSKLASIRSVYLANVDDDEEGFDFSKVGETLEVDLKVKANEINGGGGRASNIDGRITYLGGVVGLKPLSMTFLGGLASARGEIDTREETTTFDLKGKVERLRIGTLLKEFGASYPVSGILHMTYDLKGRGETLATIPQSLNGTAAASLRHGRIGTSLLDLAGLNLPTWLLTRPGKGGSANLVCMIAPLSFKDGRATTSSVVMETDDVQVRGAGYVDLNKRQVDLHFVPSPLHDQLIDIAKPFRIRGPLSDPQLKLEGTPAAGVAAELLTFPMNLVGALLDLGPNAKGYVPCTMRAAR